MIKLYETKDFYVRPFIKEDITDEYLAWFHDPEVTRHTSHGLYGYTKEQALKFFEYAKKSGDVIWAIISTDIKTGTLTRYNIFGEKIIVPSSIIEYYIGNVSLQNINQINRTAEFAGIIGNKKYWGKGIGTKAIRLLFNHGFNKLNLNKIYLGTAVTNIGMMNIAKKLGMRVEGELINHVFLEGKYINIYQFGILKEEWKWTKQKKF